MASSFRKTRKSSSAYTALERIFANSICADSCVSKSGNAEVCSRFFEQASAKIADTAKNNVFFHNACVLFVIETLHIAKSFHDKRAFGIQDGRVDDEPVCPLRLRYIYHKE